MILFVPDVEWPCDYLFDLQANDLGKYDTVAGHKIRLERRASAMDLVSR